MNTSKSRRVALVLDPDFGDECFGLAKLMPIWLIDSIANRTAVEAIRKIANGDNFALTIFPARPGESLVASCKRIIFSLDDHYNELSQSPGYVELDVIGVQLDDASMPIFHELGFMNFSQTRRGFIAKKIERDVGSGSN